MSYPYRIRDSLYAIKRPHLGGGCIFVGKQIFWLVGCAYYSREYRTSIHFLRNCNLSTWCLARTSRWPASLSTSSSLEPPRADREGSTHGVFIQRHKIRTGPPYRFVVLVLKKLDLPPSLAGKSALAEERMVARMGLRSDKKAWRLGLDRFSTIVAGACMVTPNCAGGTLDGLHARRRSASNAL
jgi:hypothetical protein